MVVYGDGAYACAEHGEIAGRCFCAYRPSDDVDFGVASARDLRGLLAALRSRGEVVILERLDDTVHLRFDGVDVSIFVLPGISKHTKDNALTAEAVLATKLHAILDRGTRRDFFDLYVMMQQEGFGLIECFRALRTVYAAELNEGLLLRAVVHFDDASAEARLPGEGPRDWELVKHFFTAAVGALVVPPSSALEIQRRVVGVRAGAAAATKPRAKSARTKSARTKSARTKSARTKSVRTKSARTKSAQTKAR